MDCCQDRHQYHSSEEWTREILPPELTRAIDEMEIKEEIEKIVNQRFILPIWRKTIQTN